VNLYNCIAFRKKRFHSYFLALIQYFHQDKHCSDETFLNNYDETITCNRINIAIPTQMCAAIYSWTIVWLSLIQIARSCALEICPKAKDFGFGPRARWSGPRWPKSPPLMTSLTKNLQPQPKNFFYKCRLVDFPHLLSLWTALYHFRCPSHVRSSCSGAKIPKSGRTSKC